MGLVWRKACTDVLAITGRVCRSHDQPFNLVRGANSNGHRLLQ
jgi:hypothetical protein